MRALLGLVVNEFAASRAMPKHQRRVFITFYEVGFGGEFLLFQRFVALAEHPIIILQIAPESDWEKIESKVGLRVAPSRPTG